MVPVVKGSEIKVRVPTALHDRISSYALEHGETLSTAVRALLIDGLDRKGIRDDVARAAREVLPQAVAQAISDATAAQTTAIRKATVAAVVAALSKAQGLEAAEEAALLQRLLD